MKPSSSRSSARPLRTLLVVVSLTTMAWPAVAAKLDSAVIGKAIGVEAKAQAAFFKDGPLDARLAGTASPRRTFLADLQ